MNDGGPAFPVPLAKGWEGMSLRDWFAGRAMQGSCSILANPNFESIDFESISIRAYLLADEMIKAREVKK